MKKETKDCHVKVRITKKEREAIEAYCELCNITISEFIRVAFSRMLIKGENEE